MTRSSIHEPSLLLLRVMGKHPVQFMCCVCFASYPVETTKDINQRGGLGCVKSSRGCRDEAYCHPSSCIRTGCTRRSKGQAEEAQLRSHHCRTGNNRRANRRGDAKQAKAQEQRNSIDHRDAACKHTWHTYAPRSAQLLI